jgi:hypothetical protein
MNPRINQQPENKIVEDITSLDVAVREMKTGVQFTEARMYEYSSGNSYDITGALAASSGSNQVLATIIVTATSVDGSSFLSAFTPELWIPNTSTPYRDSLASNYQILYNKLVTDDITKMQYWYTIGARNAVSASTFYLKAHIYSTAPVTVTYARII